MFYIPALLLTLVLILFIIAHLRLLALRNKDKALRLQESEAVDYRLSDEAIERFCELIRIPSISHADESEDDRAAFSAVQQYLERSFPAFAALVEIEKPSPYGLIACWRGEDESLAPGLLLAHYDVVPAPPEGWSSPPFAAELRDDAVWGRGALDDKNSLFGILQAAEELAAAGFRPRRTLYFAFGGDEESAGTKGAGSMAAEFASRGVRFAFVIDEGSIIARNMLPGFAGGIGLIGIEEKGFASVRLKTEGASGHASRPSSDAATHRLVRALNRISRRRLPASITPGLKGFLEAMAPAVGYPLGLLFANLWLFSPLVKRAFAGNPQTDSLIRTTLAITILNSGYKDNVLPAEAEAVCNLRLLPGENLEGVIERLRRRVNDPEVCIEALNPAECFDPVPSSPPDTEAYRAIILAIRKSFPGVRTAPFLANVTTDSKHYAPLSDAVYRFVPMDLNSDELGTIHGVDEHITLANLSAGIHFYRELIRRL